MKIVIKEPGKNPRITEIENKLSALQEAVGGYIETVTLAEDCCIICNEEGRLQGLPYNPDIRRDSICRDNPFCRGSGGQICRSQ